MLRLVRHILRIRQTHALLAQVGSAALGFLSFALLARLLEPDAFGAWLVYVTAFTLLDMLRSGTIQTALVRFASGASEATYRRYVGSAWVLALGFTGLLAGMIGVAHLLLPEHTSTAFALFLWWYPLLAFATLPYHFGSWVQQVDLRFDRLLVMRLAASFLFVLLITALFVVDHASLHAIALGHLVIQAVVSLVVSKLRWARLDTLRNADAACIRQLISFGRYSAGTLVGTNLLKSSDTFLIASLLSPIAVAMYGVAQKLIEVVALPLRAFGAVAFPALSAMQKSEDHATMVRYFQQSVGALTLLLLPVSIIGAAFAPFLLTLVGGSAYESAGVLLQIFSIYVLLLPADRYLGIFLDSLGQPRLNAIKVGWMVSANVVGNLIALWVFESLLAVAVVTITTHVTGVILGYVFINRFVALSPYQTLLQGAVQLRQLVRQAVAHVRSDVYAAPTPR